MWGVEEDRFLMNFKVMRKSDKKIAVHMFLLENFFINKYISKTKKLKKRFFFFNFKYNFKIFILNLLAKEFS